MLAEEKRGAVLEGEKVVEWLFEQDDDVVQADSIIVGKIEDIIPGMEAAFVNIGEDKNGYLYRKEIIEYGKFLNENRDETPPSIRSLVTKGEKVLVQVKKESFGTKGARLTQFISLPGIYTVYLPFSNYVAVSKKMSTEKVRNRWRELGKSWIKDDEGLIIRTVAENVDEEVVLQELNELRTLFQHLQVKEKETNKLPKLIYNASSLVNRVIRDYFSDGKTEVVVDCPQAFRELVQFVGQNGKDKISLYQGKEDIFSAYHLNKQLEKTLRNHVWLKNGAFLIIEKTEALTVIDVNTGKFLGKENLRDTVLKTNIEAAYAVAEQIRLRNIGGIILIDFIDMKHDEDKEEVINVLKKAVASDRTYTNVGGFTKFGLVEITRKKGRKSVESILMDPCPVCHGMGKVTNFQSVLIELKRDITSMTKIDDEAVYVDVDFRLYEALMEDDRRLLKHVEDELRKKIFVLFDPELFGRSACYAIRSIGAETEIKQFWTRKREKLRQLF